jgi:NAD+ kinase
MKKIKKISIIHSISRKYQSALESCIDAAETEGIYIASINSIKSKDLLDEISKEKIDLILVIGGDGTMIRAIENLLILKTPFLGINIGKLGFLTDIDVESIVFELPKIFKGEYVDEKRPLLEVTTSKNFNKAAVNEIVFHSGKIAQMMSFSIYQGDNLISKHKSDGVIVSSATGSTGYLFSGGGPIIHPTLSVFAIMPMFSQSASSNPMILPSGEKIIIKLEKNNQASIVIDGHIDTNISEDFYIQITQKQLSYVLLHPINYDYFEACRTKLSWGLPLVNIHE